MGELTKLLIKPAALGLGTTAALGGYYAVKNKGYKGKDGKFNGKQALKDLGKAGLAGAGMFGAGLAVDHFTAKNTNKKISKLQDDLYEKYKDVRDKAGYDRGVAEATERSLGILKNHRRNLNLGYGGLAAAGALGIGGKYILDKRKREREAEKKNSK